jgi:hypothetical protein
MNVQAQLLLNELLSCRNSSIHTKVNKLQAKFPFLMTFVQDLKLIGNKKTLRF